MLVVKIYLCKSNLYPMNVKPELKYQDSHEWVKQEDDNIVVVGISDFAQDALGDIVYIELLEVGVNVSKGDDIATLESVKAVSQIYAPLDGEIIEVNDSLVDNCNYINESPYDQGWIYKLKYNNPDQYAQLLQADEYEQSLNA